jgi:uncharacterized membrane-anchored protein
MNKKKIFIIIGIFWLLVIGGFVVFKEFTLKTGEEVLLKTVPVDPRDLFRGDYVILRYEISRLDIEENLIDASQIKEDDDIYVILAIGEDKKGKVQQVVFQKPNKGKFIKGVVKDIENSSIEVEYGIESYFVPEGKGKEIERNLGDIYTKIALDKNGRAVIKALILDEEEIESGNIDLEM